MCFNTEIYENVFYYLNQECSLESEVFNNISLGYKKSGLDSLDNFIVLCKTPRFPFTREHYDFYTASSQNLKLNRDFWWWFSHQNFYYKSWWFSFSKTMWESKIEVLPQLSYTSKYIIVDRNIDLPYFDKCVFKSNSLVSFNLPIVPKINEKVSYISTKNLSLEISSDFTKKNYKSLHYNDWSNFYEPYRLTLNPFKIGIIWGGPEDLEDILIECFFEYNVILGLLPSEPFYLI